MTEELKIIGEIDFRDDIKVNVYYHPDKKDDLKSFDACWQVRNPDSYYQGIVYTNNETGEILYPEDDVIPEQTNKDMEMIPKFIITGEKELNDDVIKLITDYLVQQYPQRNKSNLN